MLFTLFLVILFAFFGLMWYIVQLLIKKKFVKFASIASPHFVALSCSSLLYMPILKLLKLLNKLS